jgi:phage FluMu protein Com
MMRNDMNAQLKIKCPGCKKSRNEYNWSLKTAARYSIGADTCPTLIQVLLASLDGDEETFAGFRLVCPKCNYGINYEELEKPSAEEILAYARAVGEEYCYFWY